MVRTNTDMDLPDVILFDLDGTLLDNSDTVVDAYYTGIRQLGYDEPDRARIASQAGKNTFDTGKALGVADEDLEQLDQWFWDYFAEYCKTTTEEIPVIDQVRELLSYLKSHSVIMGVVTSNTAENARLLLDKAGLHQYFGTIVGKEHTDRHKPHPAPIHYALDKLQYTGDKIWFVGDTASDVHAAQRADIQAIAIPQSHSLPTVLDAGPELLVDDMAEFFRYISEREDHHD